MSIAFSHCLFTLLRHIYSMSVYAHQVYHWTTAAPKCLIKAHWLTQAAPVVHFISHGVKDPSHFVVFLKKKKKKSQSIDVVHKAIKQLNIYSLESDKQTSIWKLKSNELKLVR